MKKTFLPYSLGAAMLAVFLSVASSPGHAQPVKFEHLTDADGLSQNAVFCIIQDRKGFMWFGTQDGLNRYDGYSFTIFRHDPQDPNSISDNYITALCEDREGKLWIGTQSGGLNKFDPITETFVRYRHDPQNPGSLSSNSVSAVCEDAGALWVATHYGLNRLNPATHQFTRFQYDAQNPNTRDRNRIRSLFLDRSGVLWIGTSAGGLHRYDRATGSFSRFIYDPDDPGNLTENGVLTIFEDKSGVFWLGTEKNILYRIELNETPNHDRQISKLKRYDCPASAIIEDEEGRLWLGSHGHGLRRFDRKNEQMQRFSHDPNNPFSLPDVGILSSYCDRAGDLWFGTHGYGIRKYSRTGKPFRHYVRSFAFPSSIANRSVRAIYEDEQGVLWIGGYEGLDKFDRVTGTFTHYQPDAANPASIPGKDVFVLYPDPASNGKKLLIGFESDRGLARFDPVTGRFTPYPFDPAGRGRLIRHAVFALHRERSGMLWVGTMLGLYKYDEAKNELRQYRHDPGNPRSLSHDLVLSICEDAAGTLWIGTKDGLNRFERETGAFTRYQHEPGNPFSLSHNRIKCVYAASAARNALWIGTDGGGLNRFDPEQNRFIRYTAKDGLPNDVVYGILEDEERNLWLSTNAGISKFNPQTRSFRNYEARDGLQGNEFNTGASYKSKTGEMFFGGINGVTAFFPNQIKDNPRAPPLAFTGFKKFNQPVKLDTAISESKKIVLKHEDAVFSFEFAALNYTAPERNQYAFRLEGFNKDWVELGTKREVTFTNLDPGEYLLRIKGSNNDGVWNERGASIAVVIAPAIYQTAWFTALGVLLLGLTVYGGYRWRLRRHEVRALHLEQTVAERTEQLRESEAKLRAIFDNTPDYIIVVDRMHRVQFINHVAPGLKLEKVVGSSIYDYTNPDYHEKVKSTIVRVFESGHVERMETQGYGPDGATAWYLTTVAPLPREGKVQALAMLATDITEHKRADQALRESEEKFRQLAESIDEVFWLSLPEKDQLLYVSPAFEKVWGRPCADMYRNPKSFWETIHLEDLEHVRAAFARQKRGGHFDAEYRIVRPDGAVRWIRDRGFPIRDAKNRIYRFAGISQDFTERKQAEDALKQSEELFRMLYNHTPVMMHSINRNGELVNVNDYWLKVMGYEREEVLGKKSVNFLTAASRAYAVNETLPEFFQTGRLKNIEYQWVKKCGEIIDVLLSAVAVRDEHGAIARSLAFIVDVTERKRAEQTLRERENKFRTLAESITAGTFIFQGTKMRYVNSAAERMSGYSREELLHMDFWAVVHPESQSLVKERGLARQRGEAVPRNYEVKLVTKNGETRCIDFTATLIEFEGKPAVLGTALDITERKRAEAELEQSEARYRQLVECSPEPIIIYCEDRLVYANPAAAKLVGADSAEPFLGKPVLDFVHPDSRASVADRIHEIVSNQMRTRLVEVKLVRLDGEIIDVEMVGIPFTHQSKPAVQALIRDVTAGKQAEEKIKIFSHAIKNSIDGIIITDLEANIVYHNAAAAAIYGYAPNELLEKNAALLNASQEISSDEINRLTREGGGWSGELMQKTRAGDLISVALTTSIIQNDAGQALGMLGILRDISLQKQEKEKLFQTAAHLQALFKALPDMYFRVNAHDTVTDFTSPTESELYFPPGKFLGQGMRDVLPPEVSAKILDAIAEARQGNKLMTLEYALPMPHGQEYYEARIAPFLNNEAVALVRNVTARKQVEKEIMRRSEELKKLVLERTQRIQELERQRAESEKLAATGRMAARIAHEINNPLGGIQTAFRLISRAVPVEHRHHHYVDKIEKEITRISRIVRQMLELHKPQIEASKTFHPDVTILEVLALLQQNGLERHIAFKTDLVRARETVRLPENMLRQVLYNVILNALEASPSHDLVQVTAHIEDRQLEIMVCDHGPGISEEIKKRIFEPFFTTKSRGYTGGLGLGLSICKSIIEAMQGSLTFEGEPGQGTICRIIFPLDRPENFEA